MENILKDVKGTIIFLATALIYIIILATLGSNIGGLSEIITNNTINWIKFFVYTILSLPPIGLLIWIISLFKENKNNYLPVY